MSVAKVQKIIDDNGVGMCPASPKSYKANISQSSSPSPTAPTAMRLRAHFGAWMPPSSASNWIRWVSNGWCHFV